MREINMVMDSTFFNAVQHVVTNLNRRRGCALPYSFHDRINPGKQKFWWTKASATA